MRELAVLGFGALLAAGTGCGVAEPPAAERVGQSASALSVALQEAKLSAGDPVAGADFGSATAFDGDRLVVGAPGDEAAYVFVRKGKVWTQEARLSTPEPGKRQLGHAVAIAGEVVVVGAPGDAQGGAEAGAAHVFAREGGAWVEKAKLLASDAAVGDLFGSSVAISGDEILVGGTQSNAFAPGFVHAFKALNGVWTEESGALVPTFANFSDAFGVSAAMSGDAAVIGAYFTSIPGVGETAGAAYVFRRSAGQWAQEARLVGSQEGPNALAGRAVAISGDTALVAAPSIVSVTQGSGVVFVFRHGPEGWEEESKLVAGDGGANDEFGISAAISGDTAVIGSARFHDGQGPGAAYVFTRSDHTWTRQARIDAEDGAPGDRLGSAVAVSDGTVIAGARHANDAAGAAYVFEITLANGELCAKATECQSGFCVDGVCCDTACGGGDPGDCQACSTAFNATANGSCLVLEPDVVCRASSGPCGQPQTCDGQSKACPADPGSGGGSACEPVDGGSTSGTGGGASAPTGGGCSLQPIDLQGGLAWLDLLTIAGLVRLFRRRPRDFLRAR